MFAYNETVAQEYFPMTKEEALSKGLRWQEPNTKNYNVTLSFVDATQVKFTINTQTTSLLNKSQSYTLSDKTSIYVSDILYQDFAGGIHSATFYLGKDKTELIDLNIKDVDSTNSLIIYNNTIVENSLIYLTPTSSSPF